jgi:hypothetical protein
VRTASIWIGYLFRMLYLYKQFYKYEYISYYEVSSALIQIKTLIFGPFCKKTRVKCTNYIEAGGNYTYKETLHNL